MPGTEVWPRCVDLILEGLFNLFEAGQDGLYWKVLLGRFAAAPYLLLYRLAMKIEQDHRLSHTCS